MAKAHDILLRILVEGAQLVRDEVNTAAEATEEFGETTEEVTDAAEESWLSLETKIAGAVGAMGVATEAFARSGMETQGELGRLSALSGMASDDIQGMITTLTEGDMTFRPDEAIEGMDRLQRYGVDTREDFENLLPTFSDFATATGRDMGESVRETNEIMSAFGGDIHDVGEEVDYLTYLSEASGARWATFVRNMGRESGPLQDLDLTLQNAAAGVEALMDQGQHGQEAVRDFRRAAVDADGDFEAFLDTMNLSTEEWEQYNMQVGDAADGLTDDVAGAMGDTYTPMQRLAGMLEDVRFRFSGLGDVASILSPIMTGSATAMIGLNQGLQLFRSTTLLSTVATGAKTVALGALTAAKWAASTAAYALGAAFRFMTGPIGLVITAIGALVAAAIWLWNNWDDVTTWLREKSAVVWDWLGERFPWLTGLIENVISTVQFLWENWDVVWSAIQEAFGGIVENLRERFDWLIDPIETLIDWVLELWEEWDGVMSALADPLSTIAETVEGIWDAIVANIKSGINGVIESINSLIRRVNNISISFSIPDWVPVVGGDHSIGFDLPTLPTLHTGGMVPGAGDDTLINAQPGEWVFSRQATAAIGARQLAAIEHLARAGAFAGSAPVRVGHEEGGYRVGRGAPVPDHLRGQETISALRAFAASTGIPHRFTSGYRVGSTTYHGRAQAVDLAPPGGTTAGYGNPQLRALFHAFAGIGGSLRELILSNAPFRITGGAVRPGDGGGRLRATHWDHVHAATTLRDLGAGRAAPVDGDSEGGFLDFIYQPILNMIYRAFTRAFGLPDQSEHDDQSISAWRDGAVHDRRWRGMVEVGESEREITTPESLLLSTFRQELDRWGSHSGDIHVNITVDGDVLDTDEWFRRHRRPMAEAVGQAVASHNARNRR